MSAEPLWSEDLRKTYPVKGGAPVEALAGVSLKVHPG